ncbi:MAG: hypothetical protein KAJ55_11530 [Anaerolineales bacterium]|nr:hypothetical protein [Anaerolineales bacterium]
MSEKSDQMRIELMRDGTEKSIEVEKVVQMSRIADALESIEETGVYTWPQWESEEEPKDRRRG